MTDSSPGARVVDVLVPVALDQAYSYRVPPGLALAPGDVVRVPLGPRETVGIVWDSDPEAGIISYKTPLGLALLSRKVGDNVKVKLGGGEETYEVTGISRYVDAK